MPGRNPRHAAQMRAGSAAREAAMRKLIEAHPEEYRRYYVEEADKRGVSVKPETGLRTKRQKVKPLVDEIRASGLLDGIVVPKKNWEVAHSDAAIIAAQQRTRTEELILRETLASAIPPMPGSETENA